jgi:hypothetical protein
VNREKRVRPPVHILHPPLSSSSITFSLCLCFHHVWFFPHFSRLDHHDGQHLSPPPDHWRRLLTKLFSDRHALSCPILMAKCILVYLSNFGCLFFLDQPILIYPVRRGEL